MNVLVWRVLTIKDGVDVTPRKAVAQRPNEFSNELNWPGGQWSVCSHLLKNKPRALQDMSMEKCVCVWQRNRASYPEEVIHVVCFRSFIWDVECVFVSVFVRGHTIRLSASMTVQPRLCGAPFLPQASDCHFSFVQIPFPPVQKYSGLQTLPYAMTLAGHIHIRFRSHI